MVGENEINQNEQTTRKSNSKYIGEVINGWKILERDYNKSKSYFWCMHECQNLQRSLNIISLRENRIKKCDCIPKNRYEIIENYVKMYTSNDLFFYFDLENLKEVCNYKWHFGTDGYVKAWDIFSKKSTHIRIHRLVMGAKIGEVVDHINGKNSEYDNRKSNLRICTQSGNNKNKKNAKGYSWHKASKAWCAKIMSDGKQIHLGKFDTEEEARFAYLKAKFKYHKEFMPEIMKVEYEEMLGQGWV